MYHIIDREYLNIKILSAVLIKFQYILIYLEILNNVGKILIL